MIRALLLLTISGALLAQTTQPPAGAAPAAPAREPGLYATLNTTLGPIVVRLFEKEAPATVRNFVALSRGGKPWRDQNGQMVKRPLYPGTIFHRVIPRFMIQGGDHTGTGMGDPGFIIPDEFHPDLKFDVPGRLAMANAGPKTSNSQFFITEVPTPHLNGLHTIFGQVVEGQELVAKIARVPVGANDKPRTPVRLSSVTIKREGPAPAAPAKRKPAPAKPKPAAPAKK
ncbi:MAG: peptidylprolyl isomerase [Acidobacteria bacterium]|nr:peptidylprolyl isomerase [Acidobacteriota bacterium]